MTESRAWQRARKMPKGKDRTAEFRRLTKEFGFREYDLHKWGTQFTQSWINEHIGARTVEATISLAFKTVEEHLYKPGRKNIRFRRRGDLRAVEGKPSSCCHWKGDHISWRGLQVRAKIASDDAVQSHGLESRIKYVRMVRRVIRGRERFYAHLVCEGTAYRKPAHEPASGIVGLDIGTQTIAIVGEQRAALKVFCADVVRDERRIRRTLRAMDRSRRATNPDNFKEDGTIRKPSAGRLTWSESTGYKRLRRRLTDLRRSEAEHRKNLHGQLVAEVLSFGSVVRLEQLTYSGWARKAKTDGNKPRKRFGRSIGNRAPGFFVSRLKVEAEKWGAAVEEIETRTTKLSQTCHCGRSAKKGLHVRVHKCPKCGAVAQRDLYSAFLARFVEDNKLHADQAAQAWSGICAALEAAWSSVKHANGLPASLGLRVRDRAARLRNGTQKAGEIADVVPAGIPGRESREEPAERCQNADFSGVVSQSNEAESTGYGVSGVWTAAECGVRTRL